MDVKCRHKYLSPKFDEAEDGFSLKIYCQTLNNFCHRAGVQSVWIVIILAPPALGKHRLWTASC